MCCTVPERAASSSLKRSPVEGPKKGLDLNCCDDFCCGLVGIKTVLGLGMGEVVDGCVVVVVSGCVVVDDIGFVVMVVSGSVEGHLNASEIALSFVLTKPLR